MVKVEEGVLVAAWPHAVCDCKGFTYCPTFKIPPPQHDETVAIDSPELVKEIVCQVAPCSRCWDCRCKSTQNLCYRMVQTESALKESQMQTDTSLELIGLQEQVSDAHWNFTGKDIITKLAKSMKECKALEKAVASTEKESGSKDAVIASLKHQLESQKELEFLEKELRELREKNCRLEEQCLTLSSLSSCNKGLLSKIKNFTDVCTSCKSCKKKCNQAGLIP